MDAITPAVLAEIDEFLRAWRHVALATSSAGGEVEAATVGIAVSERRELVFDTLDSTRKAKNLRSNPKVALVIGWDDHRTLQVEGVADALSRSDPDYERLLAIYLGRFPDGQDRLAWPGIVHFRVRLGWLRYSDYRGAEPRIFELDDAALAQLR
jgi:general stress protein 26